MALVPVLRATRRSARPLIASLVVAVLGCGGASRPPPPPRFDPSPWRADFLELRDALGSGYANLDWALAHRRIEPHALSQRMLAAIEAARSDLDGLWALLEFVAAFADPHLRIDAQGHPVYGEVPRYPLRLTRRNGAIVITEIEAASCPLREGDEVIALDGRPIADEQRRYRRLINSVDEASALERALRLAVSSPFAPRGERLVEGRQEGAVIACRLTPVATPARQRQPPSQPPDGLAWSTPGVDACRSLGFERGSFAFTYPLPAGAERVQLGDGEFPAAVMTTPAGARVGLIRIASFQDQLFLDACAATWERLRPRQHTERCERACLEELADRSVPQEIGDRFAAVLAALTTRGVAALAIDITGNGGGNGWVEDVARMLSDREPGCGKQAVIRHPHWSRQYAEHLGSLERALAGRDLAGEDRVLVTRAADRARRMLAATKARCDLGLLWARPGYRPGCSLLAVDEGAPCGRDARRLDELSDPAGPPALVWDRAAPRVGLYRGPLFVLANGGTASASEQLVNRLKMAGRGVLLGQRTLGAGCGYTNGGLDVVLSRSRLRVRMPDCVRYLPDGENEVAGVAPDVVLATDASAPAFPAEALAAIDRTLAGGRQPRAIEVP